MRPTTKRPRRQNRNRMMVHGQRTHPASAGTRPAAKRAVARSSSTTSSMAPRLPPNPSTWPSSRPSSTTAWEVSSAQWMRSALTRRLARLSPASMWPAKQQAASMATTALEATPCWIALSSAAWRARLRASSPSGRTRSSSPAPCRASLRRSASKLGARFCADEPACMRPPARPGGSFVSRKSENFVRRLGRGRQGPKPPSHLKLDVLAVPF
mmetsp:Transcript_10246/g.19138  ORF Transcript_10246/g.19138 Transcript_10246/m.19138 type:complete len:212 (-) Transcript_10246:43-678(-)